MNNIDKIYIINLKHRTDRWEKCLEQLNKYNITNFERFDAICPDINNIDKSQYKNFNDKSKKYLTGAMGCKLSHYNVIQNAKKQNYNQVLILEDDFLLCQNFIEKYNELIKVLENENIDLNMFYLGFSIYFKNTYIDTKITNVKKMNNATTTHAYILHNSLYDNVLNEIINSDEEIDVCYTRLQKKHNIYGIYPCLISQQPSFSNIRNKFHDYTQSIHFVD